MNFSTNQKWRTMIWDRGEGEVHTEKAITVMIPIYFVMIKTTTWIDN